MSVNLSGTLDLHIDLPAGRGRGPALARALRSAIEAGRLAPGDALPPYRILAEDLGISRSTVADAYAALIEEGWLEARQGSRTRVAARHPAARSGAPAGGPAAEHNAPVMDLRQGVPSPDLFPRAAWARATRVVMASSSEELFLPAGPAGLAPLRHALAGYLARTRGVLCHPDDIIVVSGYAEALALLASVLADRTHHVEEVGLPFHYDLVRAAVSSVRLLKLDGDGAVPLDGPPPRGSVFHLTPAHQFPLGTLLSAGRRRAFADTVRTSRSWIVEDDYDGEFRYDRRPVGALQGLVPDRVIYVGSTSKSLSPALRLAWIVAPPELKPTLTRSKGVREQHVPAINQAILAELLTTGSYDQAIRRARTRYRRRRRNLVDLLGTLKPKWTVAGTEAGLHLTWLAPDHEHQQRTLEQLRARNILVDDLCTFARHPTAARPGILLGFSRPTERHWQRNLDQLQHSLKRAPDA